MAGPVGKALHRGLDALAIGIYGFRPLHPLKLRMGPLVAEPTLPAGGVPHVDAVKIPLTRRVAHLEFPSPVAQAQGSNRTMQVDVLPPSGPSRGVAIFSPFWMYPGAWALQPYTSLVRKLGLHAVAYTPPDHGGRTPAGYFSGERILGWDFPHMEGMLQLAAAELVALAKGCKETGKPVYLVGLSLGGLYAAMAALAGAPLDGLVLLTPAVDVQASMGGTAIGRRYRKLISKRGDVLPEDALLEKLGIPYRARSFERPLEPERIFLAQGTQDGVVPHSVARELAARWEMALHSYASGHMGLLFVDRDVKRDLRAFFRHRLARDGAPANPGRAAWRPRKALRRWISSLPDASRVIQTATSLGGLRARKAPR